MKLKSVEITNVFQHKHLRVQLDGHLIGIIGPNGSGKSNFLNGIHYAFAGEVPGKTKDKLLHWGADEGGVELEFEHGGTHCELSRSVSKNSAAFKYGKEFKYNGINKVADGIQERLGMDKDMLRLVFVKQAELDSVLFEQASKRETAFQRMCGIGEATRIHKRIGELLTEKFPPLPNFDEQIAVATAERANQDSQLAALERSTAELQSVIDRTDKPRLVQDKIRFQELLNAANAAQAAYNYMVQTQKAIAGDDHTIAALQHQLGPITLGAIDHEISAASVKLEAAKTYQRLFMDWTKKSQAVDALGQIPATAEELEVLKVKAAAINSEAGQIGGSLALYEKLFTTLKSAQTTVTECPLCGSEVADINVLRQRLEQEIAGCKQRQAKLDLMIPQQYAELQKRVAVHTATSSVLQKQLSEAEHMLQAAERVTENIPKLEADIAGMRMVRADLAKLFQQLEQCETRKGFHAGQLVQYNADYEKNLQILGTEDTLRGMPSNVASDHIKQQINAVDSALTGLQQHELRLATVKGQISMLRQNMNALDGTIEALKLRRAQQGTYNEVVATLNNVRDWFHYANGPHDLAISVLNELTEDVNSFLQKLNAPFTVVAEDTGLSYKCIFTDGRAMSPDGPPDASELSGGQKVMLAIAFRLASYCMFANKQGLLSLDEPTCYLDEDNIGNFCTLMDKLKEVAKALDLQILISTHERALMPFFDTVVDFTPKEINSKT